MTGGSTVRRKAIPATSTWRAALKGKVEKTVDELSRAQTSYSMGSGGQNGAATVNPAVVARAQITAAFLGRVLAAWRHLTDEVFPSHGAGIAATVVVEDLEDGRTHAYTLMAGELFDLDSSEVSLESPIGRSLLGARQGDVLTIRGAERSRKLRVTGICTLEDLLV